MSTPDPKELRLLQEQLDEMRQRLAALRLKDSACRTYRSYVLSSLVFNLKGISNWLATFPQK